MLVQDNKLRAANKWNYIKYDVKDHPINQGIYTDNNRVGRVNMQNYVNGLNYSTTYFESRSGSPGGGYYTNSVFPTLSIEPLAYSYYDNYDLDNNGVADYNYLPQSLPGEASATNKLRGTPTMVRSRTVGGGLNNVWLIKVMFYDDNGRLIQTQGNNQLHISTASDVQTIVADFTGVTQQTKVTQTGTGSNATTILSTFSYDLMYRLLAIDQAYNSGTSARVAAYEYNELGQLVKKNIKRLNSGSIPYYLQLGTGDSVPTGVTSNKDAQNRITLTADFKAAYGSTFKAKIRTNYLQAVDYRYTIRGQLKNINNSKLTDDNGLTNNDVNDVFGMDLLYEQTDANVGNTARFDGNISAVKWMTRNGSNVKTNERSYKYSYDLLNRITAATYAERAASSTSSFNVNQNGFNESGITYDVNGNILTLQRNSSSVGAASNTQVDNLTYTYDSINPNRLKKVTDGVGANYISYGFRNLTGSSADYGYDNAGNLTADPYKGLTLAYNNLNRTDSVVITTATKRYIKYGYNSAGQLIRKQAFDNGTLQKTTDYIEGFVYEDNALLYFAIPEGRMLNVSGTLSPEYIITDQQGNARISFKDDGNGKALITQENSYYAFGLTLQNSPVAPPAIPNKNLYNGGSEWQNDFSNLPDYYQTFFRNYDQALGRFVAVDPLAEAAESLTGYQYSGNNPIMFNDPLGDQERKVDFENYSPDASTGYHMLSASGGGPFGNGRRDFGVESLQRWLTKLESIREEGATNAAASAAAQKAKNMGATLVYFNGATGDLGNFNKAGQQIIDDGLYWAYPTNWLAEVEIKAKISKGADMQAVSPGAYTNAAGQVIYADGVVRNWSSSNGKRVDAEFIDKKGNIIELPGVRISPMNTMKGRGATLVSGGNGYIYLDPTGNRLVDIEHEYGHYLDYLSRGGIYYNLVVVPLSSFNTATAGSHQYYWTEIRADQLAIKFFGPNSPIAKSTYYPH